MMQHKRGYATSHSTPTNKLPMFRLLSAYASFPRAIYCLCFVQFAIVSLGCNLKPPTPDSSNPLDNSQSIVQEVENGVVKLGIEIKPKTPKLSELVELTITITHPTTTLVESPVFGQSVGDFAVRDYSERSNSPPSDTRTPGSKDSDPSIDPLATRVIKYNLEPMFSGKHLIRSIPIAYVQVSDQGEEVRDILQSEPIEVEVISEFGQIKSDLSQIDAMIDPIASEQNPLWMVLMILIAVASAILFALWMRNYRTKELPVAPILSPEQVAKIALDQLVAEQLPSRGMVKEFYLRLTGIVRVFIEGKTGLRAPEQTTEEFLRDVRSSSRFDVKQANQLQEFLTAADLVKYAGQKPDESSIQQSLERAKEFIALRFDSSDIESSGPLATEAKND